MAPQEKDAADDVNHEKPKSIEGLLADIKSRVDDMAKQRTGRRFKSLLGSKDKDDPEESEFDDHLNIDGVHEQLKKAQSKASDKISGTAMVAFKDTLTCIQNIGEIVADGLSSVFAPAKLCFSALSIVISAFQGYNTMLEMLVGMIGQAGDFLQRLVIYRSATMSPEIKGLACEQLGVVVKMCDCALKLRRKRFQFQAFMKILFLQDDDLKSLFNDMKRLEDKELRLVTAETHRDTQAIFQYASAAEKGKNERAAQNRAKEQQKERKAALLAALNWPEASLGHSSTGDPVPIAKWGAVWRRLMEQKVPNTGSWLEDERYFQEWASDTSLKLSILCIEGHDGSGKSQLAAHIIDHLQQKRGSGPLARSCVLYYFMQADTKESFKPSDDTETARDVLRSLLWQLAETSQSFLQSAGSICAKTKAGNPKQLWKSLLLHNQALKTPEYTFFIVLDGFSETTHTKFLKDFTTMMQSGVPRRFRLLITGSPSCFTDLKAADIPVSGKIELNPANLPDIELFIKHHLDDMDTLGDQSRSKEVDDIRSTIVSELKKSSKSNYRKAKRVLDKIRRLDSKEEIDDCLEEANKEDVDQISRIIRGLEQNSASSVIEDINEMLVWVINGRVWMTPLQMEDALSLKSRMALDSVTASSSESPGSHITTFRSLESKIRRGRYPLFEVNNEYARPCVTFRDDADIDAAKRHIPPKRNKSAANLQLPEVELVDHYLKAVCPVRVYDDFGFKEFFQQRLTNKHNFIFYEPTNSELIISLRCLTLLVELEHPTGKPPALYDYATTYLYDHLKSASEHLSSTEKTLRVQVGDFLVRLFTNRDSIDSLFGISRALDNEWRSALARKDTPPSWYFWVRGIQGVEVLETYFADSSVKERVRDMGLVKEFNAPDGEKFLSLLRPALELAVGILQEDSTSREVENAFFFLLVAQKSVDSRSQCKADDQSQYPWRPDTKRVESVEAWSLRFTSTKQKSALWHANIAAVLYRLSLDTEGSIKEIDVRNRLNQADSQSWHTSYTWARIDPANKTSGLQAVVERLSEDESWCASPKNKAILSEMHFELGNNYWDLDAPSQRARATASYLKSVEGNLSQHQRYLNILSRFAEDSLWYDIISLMEAVLEVALPPWNIWSARSVVLSVLENEKFSTILGLAAEHCEKWSVFQRIYEHALSGNTSYLSVSSIKSNYRRVLLERESKQDDEQLKTWEEIWETETSGDLRYASHFVLSLAVSRLLPIYTKRALDRTSEHPDRSRITPRCANSSTLYSEKVEALYNSCRRTRIFETTEILHFTRYFFLCNDKNRAKESVTELLSQSLEMMSNDDPTDDYLCFWQLQSIFHTFEDLQNAQAAMSMAAVSLWREYNDQIKRWKSPTETKDHADGSSTLASPQQESGKPVRRKPVHCDGCNKWFAHPSGLWTCSDDRGQIQFDDECYDKFKAGTLDVKVCDKSHKLFRMPDMGEVNKQESLAIADGTVEVGGVISSLTEWKAEIVTKYSAT